MWVHAREIGNKKKKKKEERRKKKTISGFHARAEKKEKKGHLEEKKQLFVFTQWVPRILIHLQLVEKKKS